MIRLPFVGAPAALPRFDRRELVRAACRSRNPEVHYRENATMIPDRTKSVGFKPVARHDARVLILGTLPGTEFLKQQQYYAKTQNCFWKIMGELTGAHPDIPYRERLDCLLENRIALWDVCAAAEREGSLDAAIKFPIPNDFPSFFQAHPRIVMVCFNGQQAETLFSRHVKPDLSNANLSLTVLPSTSPAHAGMRYEQKLARWRQALEKFVT